LIPKRTKGNLTEDEFIDTSILESVYAMEETCQKSNESQKKKHYIINKYEGQRPLSKIY